jgi:hypothetical protein
MLRADDLGCSVISLSSTPPAGCDHTTVVAIGNQQALPKKLGIVRLFQAEMLD